MQADIKYRWRANRNQVGAGKASLAGSLRVYKEYNWAVWVSSKKMFVVSRYQSSTHCQISWVFMRGDTDSIFDESAREDGYYLLIMI
jgi:hypothetical protein